MVLVDQAKLLTGGRNLTVAYFGLDKKDQNYLDRDIYVEGAAAVEAQGYFSQVWNSQEVRDVTEKRVEASPSPSTNPAPSTEAEAETLFPSLMGNDRIVTTPMKTGAATQFFSDPVEADSAGLSTSQDIYHTFEEATDSILIESAYLIMTPELQHAFEIAQARAVANGKTLQIRILTNSAIANDMDSASAAYLLDKKKLASMGIELWEYDGPDALHSKSFLIDGRKIIIGTFNLDPRSQNLNTEIAVSFDDVQAASLLKKSMDQDLEKSHLVAENGVLIPEPAYAGKMGFSRKVKIKVLEALSPILKDLF
jgi:putative cardiolipin synthase